MQNSQQIILCIPGVWKNHQELVHAMLECDTGYIYAGMIMTSLHSDHFVEVEEHNHDPEVSRIFRLFSMQRFSDHELDQIDQHNMVLYLICKGGYFQSVQNALKLGQALLKAGGLGIKIETAGLTHSKEQWLEFSATNLLDIFKAFIPVVSDQEYLYSCGMHQFGKPDGCISSSVNEASFTLNQFLLYILAEDPDFKKGDTFRAEEDMEKFNLSKRSSSEFFEADSLYFNSFGIWQLNSPLP
ncbi:MULTISPECIES: DUF4261 domain-containing protein [Acinetobacter]|jgi:hypothetical protein|uniref:DUF4261 domain-containing protein n=1 Tax=Acinetobacter TaxID=469 RepID=UPI00141BA47F|nr:MULTISPECIES: DUF4261 domain-containing protein [Acinetobacter]MCS4298163.1 hypothetical protein [Acinetobacter guillouiae]MCW2251767.1 hypothetical protein [Acinetobacter sp. BIGb0204]MDI1222301.1 DUF4261 domain-containing protein [Acinetobacter sp.]NII38421.1 hypothetical protein [Acinetobacter sp. BIGb0196]